MAVEQIAERMRRALGRVLAGKPDRIALSAQQKFLTVQKIAIGPEPVLTTDTACDQLGRHGQRAFAGRA